ncbi:hypothetical protein [Streptomyces sp. NRRL B-24484]|uniref:hypothetical protein n=1 Tax=Streptomyces sp. NRRL B-24484 TaxID=1463833 RepID=UPI0004C01F8D|nr:hypothetical protein [Streptomyces sp. NRRL B-24484]
MLFGQLTTVWKTVPWAEAVERHPFLDGPDLEFDGLFSEVPAHVLVHDGHLVVHGGAAVGCAVDDLSEREDVEVVHVIDGDLTVEGSLRFANAGHYPTLCVTGSVTAENLLCESECVLFVGGALRVDDLLVTDLYEGGLLSVEGPSSVGAWLQLESRETRTRLGGGAAGRAAEVRVLRLDGGAEAEAAAAVLLPEFFDGDRLDRGRLAAAAAAGRPLTRRRPSA